MGLSRGSLYSTKYSDLKFLVFHATNGIVFPDWLNQPVPGHHVPVFFGENKRRTDVLLALELLEDSQVEINDLLSKFDEITFISGAFTFVDS